MGHYLACRYYDVDATLPYFIPMPVRSLTGTLGAVIRIREPFPTRTVLFDIGVAGPIAGFVVLVPALFLGHVDVARRAGADRRARSAPRRAAAVPARARGWCSGRSADGYSVNIHPMVFAAWFGMLATALNLLPFGQLDGGHITYATLGRWSHADLARHRRRGASCMTLLLDELAASMTVMMLAMLLPARAAPSARASTSTSRSDPAGISSRSSRS